MNTKQLNDIKCMLEDAESQILGTKGNEYVVSNEDRLKFFKDYATQLGIDPKIVCSIFLMKHINSILNFAKTNQSYSENIKGRINDARNYLLFMQALIEDEINEHLPEDAGSTQREFDEEGAVCSGSPATAGCLNTISTVIYPCGGSTSQHSLSATEEEVRSQEWEENCRWNLNNEPETIIIDGDD